MTEIEHTWSSAWPELLRERVRNLGFSNLTDLLRSMPGRTYGDVARELGCLAPIQVVAIQFQEAEQSGRVREAAKDSLCRNLVTELPRGWGGGDDANWNAIHALAIWRSGIESTGGFSQLEPILVAISRAVLDLPPPDGWIPTGSDDEIIRKIFDLHWPETTDAGQRAWAPEKWAEE